MIELRRIVLVKFNDSQFEGVLPRLCLVLPRVEHKLMQKSFL